MKRVHGKLHHEVPAWVEPGAIYHVRVRCAPGNPVVLTQDHVAKSLLEGARLYVQQGSWFVHGLLLMPDHLHALLSFCRDRRMGDVVGRWKAYQSGALGIRWQENFFDHRIRNAGELAEKWEYIMRNPVASGLCRGPEEWPWVLSAGDSEN